MAKYSLVMTQTPCMESFAFGISHKLISVLYAIPILLQRLRAVCAATAGHLFIIGRRSYRHTAVSLLIGELTEGGCGRLAEVVLCKHFQVIIILQ